LNTFPQGSKQLDKAVLELQRGSLLESTTRHQNALQYSPRCMIWCEIGLFEPGVNI